MIIKEMENGQLHEKIILSESLVRTMSSIFWNIIIDGQLSDTLQIYKYPEILESVVCTVSSIYWDKNMLSVYTVTT